MKSCLAILKSQRRRGTKYLTLIDIIQWQRLSTSINDSPALAESILETVQHCQPVRVVRRFSSSTKNPDQSDYKDDTTIGILESFANLDHNRGNRTGFPEAVFAEGKTAQQIAVILDDMAEKVNETIIEASGRRNNLVNNSILATRVKKEQYKEISRYKFQNGVISYNEIASIISMKPSAIFDGDDTNDKKNNNSIKCSNKIVVACAGTTDLPVAEEAAYTLEMSGNVNVDRIYDVGVAGLHRIINALPRLRDPSVRCIIVCAGMDGALP